MPDSATKFSRSGANGEIDPSVSIDPRCLLGEHVAIGARSILHPYVVLHKGTSLGDDNHIHPFAVLGGPPQQIPQNTSYGGLAIGSGNIIREHVTINAGTCSSDTTIGNQNLIMSGCHIGHDSYIGNDCIIASNSSLAGHVVLQDRIRIGGSSALAEHVQIGRYSFVGGHSAIDRDIPPFCVAYGDRPSKLRGCNLRALRQQFDQSTVRTIYKIVSMWMDSSWSRSSALRGISSTYGDHWAALAFLDLISKTKKGVLR